MANSAAVIGAPTLSTVTEDANNASTLIAAGSISISDADAGQAAFKTTVTAASGDLGSLTIAANGAYVYAVADSKVQYLGAGETKVDTFTVSSLDGTIKQVSFTILGVNDTAVIGNPTVHDVTEDRTTPNLVASGSISISDADRGQAAFSTTVVGSVGNIGNLVLASNGSYTYTVSNNAAQYLGAADTQVDTFTVTALDGTSKLVSFNVHGKNDAAIIGNATLTDVTEDASTPTLTATGTISIVDVDQGQSAFQTAVRAASGNLGNLVLASNGSYTYSVADSVTQYLGAGETRVDSFTVTSLDGTTRQISFTIHGVNDAAVIGTPTVVDVTEDARNPNLRASGTISISDADHGQAAFQTTVISSPDNLGHLTLSSQGSYSYTVSDSAVQYLGAGESRVETFTISSLDGTSRQISFTIHGNNDAAVIGTPTVHDVTEDASVPTLTASGSISITDADQGQASFQTAVVSAAGNLGGLTLAADGQYSYTVANSATQYLGAGDTRVDSFTVTSLDGTTRQVSFTVHGINDAAVIGTPTVSDVTEDATRPTLVATGSISISDVDQGEAAFRTSVVSTAGNLGHLSLASNGTYTYSLSNNAAQYLGANDTKIDTFTVTALDGTTKQVSFSIHGNNDAAVIGNPSVHDVTEDARNPTLTASGTLSISDVDQNQASFQTAVASAAGNLGSLAMAANGAYTYSVANSATQYLGAGLTKVDTFTVSALDGTTKQISFTIHGINDAAVIQDPTVHDVYRNASPTTLTATGIIGIQDVDLGEASFRTTVRATSGNLGSLTLGSDGTYTYSVANSATQYLGAAGTKVDTFTVTSLDGTSRLVAFTIHGSSTNQPAVIGNPTVADVTEDSSPTTLSASGTISISDPDAGQATFQTTVVSAPGNLGSLTLTAAGSYTYSVANGAVQYLGAGEVRTEAFMVTSQDGTTKQVSFTIHGTNDAASIGAPAVSDVTEDSAPAVLVASGTIAIADIDQNQGSFQTSVVAAPGTLGSLTLASDGSYSYSVANAAVQYLGAGDSKVETFTVTALDGTTKQVSFTIHGANDAASIGAPTASDVTEDTAPTTLIASGSIAITDPDQNQASFQTSVTAAQGTLGSLTLASDGSYSYSVANAAVQYLGAGDSKVETFTVTALDGTTKQVSFTIHGANDVASIGAPTASDVTEDTAPTTLIASGSIAITDPDQNQASFQTSVTAAQGTLGSLTLASDGSYSYSVANAAVQYLGAGDSKVETFTVTAQDGTTKQVSFTIHGANDAASIGNPTVVDLTEDSTAPTLSLSGQVSVVDPDSGQSAFSTTTVSAPGNLGQMTITADGHYTYSIDNAAVQGLAAGEVRVETFTVASVDGTQKPISFTIHGAQDAPLLTVADAAGASDAATIPLSIAAHMVDDSGALSAISITGIPASFTLNHGTVFDDGHWEVAATDLGDLALVPGADAQAGALTLHVSVASIEGGSQLFAPTETANIAVSAGAGETSARAVDGYIAGAFVFADANGNGVFDVGEASATTRADGTFTLHNAHGTLVMSGGTDISTGLAFNGTLTAPDGSTVVTPLTTLVTSVIASAAAAGTTVTAEAAAAQVAAAFGIDSNVIDLTSYDPVPAAVAGNAAATAVLAAGVQVQSTVAQISAVGGSSADVFDAIAGAISGSTVVLNPGETILTSSDSVQSIAATSGVSTDALATVTSVVQAANTSIQTATDVTAIAQAGQVAQGSAAASLASITDFTDTAQTGAVTQTFVADLSTQVNGAVVASPAGPVLGTSGNDNLAGTSAIDTIDGLDGNDQISGGAGADLLFGGGGNDRIAGNAGNDRIDGGAGFDRALYADATGGVTFNMAAGTASGAGVDSDSLTNIEGIVGSSSDDTYNAAGFVGVSGVPGSPVGYNEFEGGAGNDTVIGTVNASGAYLTRVSYVSATAAVNVDLAAGTADGDASVGHDTFVGPGIQSAWGSAYNDTLSGSNNGFGTVEVFAGFAGNDTINGRGGFDRVDYNQDSATTSGITVNLAAGTATGDASVGTDTLRSVEAVRGTNFADFYDATNFSGASTNAGSNGTFNEFTGGGGNDTIIGNSNTRISFNNATAGVTVDLQTGATPGSGTATGDGSVGTDTFSGVNAVQGSMFADTIYGSNSTATETFTGNGGNDYIDGRGGFDIVSYNNIYLSTGGIAVDMAVGTVVGDASIGTDTLRSIEGVQGTVNADSYVATGYGVAGALNVGNNGTFNQFEGLGGNDTITGNGNTRVIYANAAAAVTVNLALGTAGGTAAGDAAAVGTDTITGGVNSIAGSVFGDTLIGNGASNVFVGNGGNDTIDGGAGGDIAIFTGGRSQYTITLNSPGAGQTTVTDGVAGRDGSDTLTNVEVLQFSNTNLLIASGSGANPVNLTDGRLFFNAAGNPLSSITGNTSDYVSIGQTLSGHTIDLGAGVDDTVILGVTGSYQLNLANVEHLTGSNGGDFLGLLSIANGLSIDMGGGADTVNLANGSNAVSVVNVENLNGSDFAAGSISNDTLTLLNTVSGLSVNLGNGVNTLNLAAGANTFVNLFSVDAINGSGADDTLTVGNGPFTPNNDLLINLGAGDDTLNLAASASGVTVANVEHVNGGAFNDIITITSTTGITTVTAGGGADFITASAATDILRYTSASDSAPATGMDTVANFDSAHDSFLLDNVAGLAGPIHFMASGVLDGTAATPHAEAILTSFGGQQQLQIDVNGDGSIGAGDITVILNNLAGTLSDANFSVITPNHAPTNIAISNATVAENSPANTVVGSLSDTDPDAGDSATFALTNDAGGLFAISGGNLVTTAPLNYEQAATYTVTVQVTDAAGAVFAKDLQIGVTDVNEAPTNVALSNAAVPENSPAGTVVGNLSVVDPDAGDSATYTLLDDAGGLFSLSGGVLSTAAPLDFEQAASHQITVRATDSGGLTVDRTFVIATTNVNEAPVMVLLSNASIAENSPASTVVGALSAPDPDAGDSATFALTDDAGGLFAISGGNLVAMAPLNYEQATSHQVTVRATDAGGLTHDTSFAIATSNVNEAPTDISLSNAAVFQNAAVGAVVGALAAVDPDADDGATLTLLDNDGGQFGITGGNLVVAGALTAGPQSVTVRATDTGGLSFDKVLSVTVNGGALVVGDAAANTLFGTAGDDTIQGLGGNDRLQGLAGNDALDGGQGFDRAVYSEAASGITVSFAAGTVTGGAGSDTITGIEAIVGSEFADVINAAGFTGDSGIAGNPLGLNEIEGRGGNDTITSDVNSQGAPLTRISYIGAAAGVTVDLTASTAHGTAAGDTAAVGTDTLVGAGFSGIIGSAFADSLLGSNNAAGTVEIFDGRGGNDTLNGRGGFDRADYALDPATTSGITVSMQAGTVVGDASIGTDTLLSIESVRGTNFNDIYTATGFTGTSANAGSNGTFNEFNGMGGNDSIAGNGNTRLAFVNATGAVTVDIQAGTDSGDTSTGSDTFSGVNAIQASMFDDTLLGSNSTASTETFAGLAGNDFIDGRGGFDLATYNNIYFSTGPVTVNMGAGTATGDASIGTDTLRSIEAVQGTNFDDVYNALTFGTGAALNIGNNGTFNQFEGIGGNDSVTGNGNTRLIYSSATGGVSVNMLAGTVTGDASVGSDSFTGVNSVTGSAFADTYVATGLLAVTGPFGSGTFNLFEGLGGNDSITGNGNTRIAYSSAAAAVTVDLSLGTARGTANGDTAGVGFDTIAGGVNSVQGSNFNDTLIGGTGNETFFGGSGADTIYAGGGDDAITGGIGNDTINGGAGTDMAIFSGASASYTITLATGTVTDNRTATSSFTPDGTDTLTGVEVLQFTDKALMIASGSAASPIDISNQILSFTGPIVGTGSDDYLTVGSNAFGHQLDLGAGNDTVNLAAPNFYTLNLANVEHVLGSTGADFVTLTNVAAGLTVDLSGGSDTLTLANGANVLSVANVETINGSDFTGGVNPSNDTLTLLTDVSGLSINLGDGTNTVNLAAGSNALDNLFGVATVNASASDDVLTVNQQAFNTTFNLGAGNDTISFASQANSYTVTNAEVINGSSANDILTLGSAPNPVAVTGGMGADTFTIASAADHFAFNFTSAAQSQTGNGDAIINFNAATDSFTFTGMSGAGGFTGPVHFVDGAAFDGTAATPHSEARVDSSGGTATLQIDVNGDGVMSAADVEIHLINYTGTLTDSNFLLI